MIRQGIEVIVTSTYDENGVYPNEVIGSQYVNVEDIAMFLYELTVISNTDELVISFPNGSKEMLVEIYNGYRE